jgi:hypothetical protein
MSSSDSATYVIDCHGLVFLAHTRNNAIRDMVLSLLEAGTIKVPHYVWREFRDAYEDEAHQLEDYIAEKIKSKAAHRAAAGAMASRADSGFRPEPYNDSDWMAGAVAQTEECVLITISEKVDFYSQLLNCEVISITRLI